MVILLVAYRQTGPPVLASVLVLVRRKRELFPAALGDERVAVVALDTVKRLNTLTFRPERAGGKDDEL